MLDSVVFSKHCATCTKHYSLHGVTEELKKYKCVKNYKGTSKAVEAAGLVLLLTRAPEHYSVSIGTIISDDDSNGRAKARHVVNGGQLPDYVEEPKFLADPSHQKCVLARSVYNLASAPI